ncbi:MAG TPA: type II secretion system protein [Candidatus Limnocylindrales bacterium]|nr:type II secretion system protein [Candidatus Limnocylindrales bacterium]
MKSFRSVFSFLQEKYLFFATLSYSSPKGFTLIELLIVIAIVGIMATGIIATLNPAAQFAKARDSARKAGIRQITNALDAYRLTYGAYPTPGWIYSNDPVWKTFLGSELRSVPVDPTQSGCSPGYPWVDSYNCWWYMYYSPDGTTYILVAHLENRNDPERCELKQYKYVDGNSLCGYYGWSNYIYAPGPTNY